MKTKVRFDGLDVAAMVAHWNRVALGRRVINIYNGSNNGDTYLFKLDKLPGESTNLLLILESGIRFHGTQQQQNNSANSMPSPFCAKLRKHLRGLRLETVQQLGQKDRVVHLVFGSGPTQRHSLMLELYARGNLVLTNANYIILALLRSHEYTNAAAASVAQPQTVVQDSSTTADTNGNGNSGGSAVVKVQVGHAYPVTYATTTVNQVSASESKGADDDDSEHAPTQTPVHETLLTAKDPMEWYAQHQKQQLLLQSEAAAAAVSAGGKKGKKKKKGDANNTPLWKTTLLHPNSGVSHYGPALIEHCWLVANDQQKKKQQPAEQEGDAETGVQPKPRQLEDLTTLEDWKHLQSVLHTEGDRILQELEVGTNPKGYILYQPKPSSEEDDNAAPPLAHNQPHSFHDKLLTEFQPHLLHQHQSSPVLEYESFDAAVDAFFSHIDGQKVMLRAEQQKQNAQQRLDKIKLDQQQRVDGLLEKQEEMKRQAQVVELNADMVEKAIQVVNSALDSGMDWDQLEALVQVEKEQNHNPVALLIQKLDLEQDLIVLKLETYEEENPTLDIPISLKETAHGNASALFAKYRNSKDKFAKTLEGSTKALKAAEESAQRQLLEAQKRTSHAEAGLQNKRKPFWFEKFLWFITSDNYLVIAGRDAQQNEQIVKRYLRAGDAYLHADVHGAASCVLRAKRRRQANGKSTAIPLSDQALREAGNFTICRSSAWASRMITSAWWVESHQVSKTAPTGEYLTVGSFMIRGKKNFLPPSQLEMGLGVLFRLGDDDSIARHKNDRRDFALMQMDEELVQASGIQAESVKEPILLDESAEKAPNDSKTDNSVSAEHHPTEDQNGKPLENDEDVQFNLEKEGAVEGEKDEQQVAAEAVDEIDDIKENDDAADAPNKQMAGTDVTVKVKKGLSARDRKLIKKYGSLEAAEEAEAERKRLEAGRRSKAEEKKAAAPLPQETAKRGKRAKMKRAAKKYAHQDEEDKELALMALHAGEKEKRAERKKPTEINETEKVAAADTIAILKKDAAEVAGRLPAKVREILEKCVTVTSQDSLETTNVRWDKFDADVLEQLIALEMGPQQEAAATRLLQLKESTRLDNFSASLGGIIRTIRKYGHVGLEPETSGDGGKRKTKSQKAAESESWKQTLAAEGVTGEGSIDDDGFDDTAELLKLTGKVLNEDLILFAVPVCAPYHTLSKYSYRVKLTPGNMKRGKAAKGCIEMFMKDAQSASAGDRNKKLIKSVPDNEWLQAICGDVKISAAGASKVIQKQKMKNKNKAKKRK